MPNEIYESYRFGNDRRNTCTGNAHRRKSKVTKYQGIVENDIGDGHQNSRSRQDTGLCNSNIKSPENHIQKGEKETVDPPVHIFDRSFVHMLRTDKKFHDMRYTFD